MRVESITMKVKQHKNARTTLRVREEIKSSQYSVNFLATKYNLSWATVNKWRKSDSIYDKSSRPNRIRTDLTEREEQFIVFHRKHLKNTIEDIYFAFEKVFPNKKIYPMKVYRCLRRHGLNVLPKEFKEAEKKIKRFKKYGIGYIHIDLMYTKRLNDNRRYYIFTCIDRVSKLAYVKLTNSKSIKMSAEFLKEVVKYFPYKINYILTDNGMEFTYRGVYGRNRRFKPKRMHPFKRVCIRNDIDLRHTKYRSPWTNGMVERFNRKVREGLIDVKYFRDIDEMAEDLVKWINKYNFNTRLRGLNYRTPIDYLIEEGKITESNKIYLKQTLTTYRY